jgi:hypothetical protein
MAKKKKPRFELRKVPVQDLQQGPIRHKKGLTPLLEKIARAIFAKVGRFVHPTFEQLELDFMRDAHPWREILIWEIIARTFDLYMAAHPEARNSTEIVGTIAWISTGMESKTETEKELRKLYEEAYKNMWVPLVGEPFVFPEGEAVVLQYRDIVDERDGRVYPNLRGAIDCRQVLAAASIFLGKTAQSEGQFCIYGSEHCEDGKIPWGFGTVVVCFNSEDEKKHGVDKMCVIVEQIKGRHDCP